MDARLYMVVQYIFLVASLYLALFYLDMISLTLH